MSYGTKTDVIRHLEKQPDRVKNIAEATGHPAYRVHGALQLLRKAGSVKLDKESPRVAGTWSLQ